MKRKTIATLSLSALGVLVTPAYANSTTTSPWYVGGSIGSTNNNTDASNLFANPDSCSLPGRNCSTDDKDTAVGIHAGYQINPNFSVELGYIDLGDTVSSKNSSGAVSLDIKQETKALTLAAKGKRQIGASKISAFGKVGIARWESKASLDRTPNNATLFDRSTKKNGVDPLLGIGLEYEVNSKVKLQTGWDRYYNVGETSRAFDNATNTLRTVDTDVDVFYVGATFNF